MNRSSQCFTLVNQAAQAHKVAPLALGLWVCWLIALVILVLWNRPALME